MLWTSCCPLFCGLNKYLTDYAILHFIMVNQQKQFLSIQYHCTYSSWTQVANFCIGMDQCQLKQGDDCID